MRYFTLLLSILFFTGTSIKAQEPADSTEGWKKSAILALGLNQVSLSNWAAGGEGSLSFNSLVSLGADYRKDKSTWDNSLEMSYGLIKSGDSPVRKNDDKLDLNSKYGQHAFKSWYYSALVNFKSQFLPGYNYPNDSIKVSELFAPAYLTAAIGMDYKPSPNFSLFLSPATGKFTFVSNQDLANAGAYGVEAATFNDLGVQTAGGENIRSEFGAYLNMKYKRDLMENVVFQTKLDLFNNYTDKDKDNAKNIDVNWETLIALKVNKFLSTNFFTHLIYDHNIKVPIYEKINGVKTIVGAGPRTQFKQILGVTFSAKF